MSQQSQLVRKIVLDLIPTYPSVDGASRYEVESAVVDFVGDQIRSMPGYIGAPYQVALFGFNWLSLLIFGRPYTRLTEDKARRYLAFWDQSSLNLCRDVIKLLRTCTLLAYLDHPIVVRHLEGDDRGVSGAG